MLYFRIHYESCIRVSFQSSLSSLNKKLGNTLVREREHTTKVPDLAGVILLNIYD